MILYRYTGVNVENVENLDNDEWIVEVIDENGSECNIHSQDRLNEVDRWINHSLDFNMKIYI